MSESAASGFPETPGNAPRVTFTEYGTHKHIHVEYGGTLRLLDQRTIDALREAFEKAGWEVEDRVG